MSYENICNIHRISNHENNIIKNLKNKIQCLEEEKKKRVNEFEKEDMQIPENSYSNLNDEKILNIDYISNKPISPSRNSFSDINNLNLINSQTNLENLDIKSTKSLRDKSHSNFSLSDK